MSLFKVRDWWATTCGHDEEFDQGCLCVANIDNQANGTDKIVVGSFQGMLRIYSPHPLSAEDGTLGVFKPDDLLLEVQMSHPILQIEIGHLVSGSENIHLAILHPLKVSIVTVSAIMGSVEHGTQCQLSHLYEHKLKCSAFNMVLGPFGGVKGRDFICVQSVDGTLSFFEQDSFSFSRFLPGFLLPGPLAYIPRTDSFLTVSSSWQLESYKYQVLAVAVNTETKEESQKITSGKRVAIDWAFILGETALKLHVMSHKNSPAFIYVLGERHLFCLKDTGVLLYMKRLEFSPSTFLPYTVADNPTFLLMTNHSRTLMVFQEISLRWAAQLPFIPVDIQIATFQDLKGVIVFLSEEGELIVGYLGTNPALFVPPSVESREINYSETDKEMAELQKIIKTSQKSLDFLPKLKSECELNITVTVAKNLDPTPPTADGEINQETDPVPSVSIGIQLKSLTPVQNIRLTIQVTKPLVATHSVFTFPSISDAVQVVVSVFMKHNCIPPDLTGQAIATYGTATGMPHVVIIPFELPLRLVVKPALPLKEAQHKITISTNCPAVSLNNIFSELVEATNTSSNQALGFEYFGGPIVTLLAAKTSQRYRLQSSHFEAMWLIVFELIKRLKDWFAKSETKTDLLFSFSSNIPLQEYFEVIDQHFQCRQDLRQFQELLSQRAQQFRAVQKRLLTKFKDKAPTPLNNMDTLLEGTFRQILSMIELTEKNEQQLLSCQCSLSCATQLIVLLIKLQTGMNQKDYEMLSASFSPNLEEGLEQGWEESVDASLTYLLRTSLAKAGKEPAPMPGPNCTFKDTTRLKKHMVLVVDRLCRGGRILEKDVAVKETNSDFDSEDRIPDGAEDDDLSVSHVPTGSRFGDRAISARLRRTPTPQVLPEVDVKKLEKSVSEEKPSDLEKVTDIPIDEVPSVVASNSQVPDLDDIEF